MSETPTAVADPKPEAHATQPNSPAGEGRYRRKAFLGSKRAKFVIVLAVLVLIVAGLFIWRYLGSYEATDDAQIDGHINSVSARVSGHVVKLSVEDNQYVQRELCWLRSIRLIIR